MSTTPNFASTPRVGAGQVSAANTARDGTGTLVTLFTAGASGSRIERVAMCATVTTTDNIIRLFVHDGSTARLIREVHVLPRVPTAGEEVWQDIIMLDLMLPTTYSLRASVHKAEAINVFALGGDF